MQIVKKGKYYYLKDSVREDGKVVTREKYLGLEVPTDLKIIAQDLKRENRKSLYQKLEKIQDNFQKEWKRLPESAKKRERRNCYRFHV